MPLSFSDALLVAGRGVGNILTAPISSALLSKSSVGTAFKGAALAYGVHDGAYAPLILFVGTAMALSSLCAFYPVLQKPFAGSVTMADSRDRPEL